MLRLFVGVGLPTSIAEKVGDRVDQLRSSFPNSRWVPPANYHITLKFIGEWKPERLAELVDKLKSVRSDPFSLSLNGWGGFPNLAAPNVMYIGVKDPQDHLVPLARQVDQLCQVVGIGDEGRDFHPHVTIARKAQPLQNLSQHLSTNQNFETPEFKVTSFALFRSDPSPQGQVYSPVEHFELRR